jgi:hypothetical protein
VPFASQIAVCLQDLPVYVPRRKPDKKDAGLEATTPLAPPARDRLTKGLQRFRLLAGYAPKQELRQLQSGGEHVLLDRVDVWEDHGKNVRRLFADVVEILADHSPALGEAADQRNGTQFAVADDPVGPVRAT